MSVIPNGVCLIAYPLPEIKSFEDQMILILKLEHFFAHNFPIH